MPLAKSLYREIVRLGKRLEHAAIAEEVAHGADHNKARVGPLSETHHAELLLIIKDIKALLERIDRDIPLLQLAITASGEKMSSTMTPGISPSRMMQASALLSFADAHFVVDPSHAMQVGPSFTLSLYMLFLGHSHLGPGPGHDGTVVSPLTPSSSEDDAPARVTYGLGEGERKPIWQEVMHKARVRLCRTATDRVFDPVQGYRPSYVHEPVYSSGSALKRTVALPGPSDGYAYHLEIIEDLDDGRLHDGDGLKPQPYDDMPVAGIRESIPIHQISKIFYTDTGRILNIGNNDERDNNPVLLLKRDANAKSPIKVRQEWFDEPQEEDGDESHFDTAVESPGSDDQDDVDRQLWEETKLSPESACSPYGSRTTNLPAHLDPEWLALEVFTEDDHDGDEDDDVDGDEGDDAGSGTGAPQLAMTGDPQALHTTALADSKLVEQIGRLSMRAGSPLAELTDKEPADIKPPTAHTTKSYTTRSPFGAIASSLSLLEMLIRLTSLQEFQQTSHLAIPDHILTFFLDETSTTGLQGEAHWRIRRDAKRRMGFDPYTDALPR